MLRNAGKKKRKKAQKTSAYFSQGQERNSFNGRKFIHAVTVPSGVCRLKKREKTREKKNLAQMTCSHAKNAEKEKKKRKKT